ncbi:MAG: hypothetical protein E7680_03055 [Ruminococcaceae bacterium]|nr:hypothetical protein [Oscillospiraceae bacterium]
MNRKILVSFGSLLLAVVLLFLTVSCQKKIIVEETDLLKVYFGESENPQPRKADEVKGAALPADFQTQMAQFAFSLLNRTIQFTEAGENQLLSPLSAMYCLALIANGAGKETRAQMSRVLGMAPEELNPALLAYALGLPSGKDVKIEMANSVWFQNTPSLKVNDSFLQTVADWYAAQVYASAFDDETVKNINAWCEKYTDGMIKKMIENIDSLGMLYLINALVFDAKWETEYEDHQVGEGEFTAANGEKQTVTFLSSNEYAYLAGKNFEGVVKYYKGGDYAFVGLLPKAEIDAETLAETLTGDEWMTAWQNKSYETVKTKIPEFKTESSIRLTDILREMGMTDAFDPTVADFLPMGTCNDGGLCLSNVMQKTYLEVDRNGTKAAAVTWGEIKFGSAPPSENSKEIYLDRPFVYLVVDTATGIPSFIGVTQTLR